MNKSKSICFKDFSESSIKNPHAMFCFSPTLFFHIFICQMFGECDSTVKIQRYLAKNSVRMKQTVTRKYTQIIGTRQTQRFKMSNNP